MNNGDHRGGVDQPPVHGQGDPQTESEDVSEVTSDEVAVDDSNNGSAEVRNGHHYEPASGRHCLETFLLLEGFLSGKSWLWSWLEFL